MAGLRSVEAPRAAADAWEADGQRIGGRASFFIVSSRPLASCRTGAPSDDNLKSNRARRAG
jgi:hypothetical protein